ncbi:hypothetical protein ABS71_03645 [bacterium SCN 62-11]|nr:MAG: hypothetical protein ABS71_03645 [bacterium SCN 62-11]
MRRWGLAGLGLLLGLLLAELILRLFFPRVHSAQEMLDNRPAMFLASDHLPFELAPRFVGRLRGPEFRTEIRLNSQGYRGPECVPGSILCIGDSFTFGHGVEEGQTWVRLLGSRLGRPVINAGYHGALYPDGYLVYLTREGLRLKPSEVVVALFVGNDLDDATLPPRTQDGWTRVDAEGLPLATTDPSSEVYEGRLIRRGAWLPKVPLLRHSRLLNLFWGERRRLRGRAIYETPWTPRVEEKMRVLRELLAAMQRRCRAAGVPLRVVLIPQLAQVGRTDLGYPQQRLGQILRDLGIPFLDLLGRMQTGDYYAGDQHWNAAGHARAAGALGDWLSQP